MPFAGCVLRALNAAAGSGDGGMLVLGSKPILVELLSWSIVTDYDRPRTTTPLSCAMGGLG